MAASACAEVIADVLLCPMEAVNIFIFNICQLKVKMQTADHGTFPREFKAGFDKINASGEFYKGIVPLWMRQVPYTMVKFAAFENTVKAFYKHIFTNPKDTYSKNF